jgi:outer membrane scaffolding protein for murein synthesis (MipA/OmpV family)
MTKQFEIPATIFALTISQNIAFADRLPLWEVSAGAGVLTVPDYRGSADTQGYPFPFLFPFYRGAIFRSDEEGVRGELFKTPRIKLDFSLDGGVPVDSSKNDARQGMPDLDATGQIGPALNIKLWQDASLRQSLIAFLPVRAVLSIGSGVESAGYTFSPQLTYYSKADFIGVDWRLGWSVGLEYGSGAFHDYYYQVDNQYATANRPAYDAEGGFAGYRSNFSFHHRFPDKWVSIFARYDNVTGAVFDDSPLVTRQSGFTFGFLVSWFFWRSDSFVEDVDWKYE